MRGWRPHAARRNGSSPAALLVEVEAAALAAALAVGAGEGAAVKEAAVEAAVEKVAGLAVGRFVLAERAGLKPDVVQKRRRPFDQSYATWQHPKSVLSVPSAPPLSLAMAVAVAAASVVAAMARLTGLRVTTHPPLALARQLSLHTVPQSQQQQQQQARLHSLASLPRAAASQALMHAPMQHARQRRLPLHASPV